MSDIIEDSLVGSVSLKTLPEREVFRSIQEFIERLPDLLIVNVPKGVSGVVISHTTPSEDERNKLWIRRDFSGRFLGLYIFADGKWHKYYDVGDGEVRWFVGDSEKPPEGFVTILDGDEVVPSDVVSNLVARYVPKSVGEGYLYFAARFEGF